VISDDREGNIDNPLLGQLDDLLLDRVVDEAVILIVEPSGDLLDTQVFVLRYEKVTYSFTHDNYIENVKTGLNLHFL
jgi:hypothetical protein